MAIAGAYVVHWGQTSIEGVRAAPLADLAVGVVWRWRGDLTRIDGPHSVLQLTGAEGAAQLCRGAAGRAGRLIGEGVRTQQADRPTLMADQSITVSDGKTSHTARIVRSKTTGQLMLCFEQDHPRPDQDYWVIKLTLDDTDRTVLSSPSADRPAGVICFGAGTRIDTPMGPRLVEALQPGDFVLTRDSGPQEVLWTGSRRMSGARLFAMPICDPCVFTPRPLAKTVLTRP